MKDVLRSSRRSSAGEDHLSLWEVEDLKGKVFVGETTVFLRILVRGWCTEGLMQVN